MGQTTIVLMIITILSKIFGFVRETVMEFHQLLYLYFDVIQ